METYLVGGAVRDQLLGLAITERDWVVVGATPQSMLDAGFTPVGKDFPVFLHPKTNEEYALARTERKQGHGYKGFEFFASPDTSLEQDLLRRDLTINAIAQADDGTLIDPYGGQRDIEQRILRHVSDAFVEDPLRVLRVARFHARFKHLGFKLAPETLALLRSIAASGELAYLVAERSWKELERSLLGPDPATFFTTLREAHALEIIMPELDKLWGVPQRADYHPEIDTGIHTMMVLTQAARLSDSGAVRYAALVHDLGKGNTPEDILPRHIGHEQRGLPLIKAIAKRMRVPTNYTELALLTCELHGRVHRIMEAGPEGILKLLERSDAFRRPQRFDDMLLACEADSRGRKGLEEQPYPAAEFLRRAYEIANAVDHQTLLAAGFSGKRLGDEIRNQRRQALTALAPKTD